MSNMRWTEHPWKELETIPRSDTSEALDDERKLAIRGRVRRVEGGDADECAVLRDFPVHAIELHAVCREIGTTVDLENREVLVP